MERLLTVEFGPSRSQRFGKAVARAQSGPGECTQIEPGRYRVTFLLGTDAAVYSGLARLLEWVRHWRATEVYDDEEQVSSFHAREMAWCASSQLEWFGECRWRFDDGVLPRMRSLPAVRRRAGDPRRDAQRAAASADIEHHLGPRSSDAAGRGPPTLDRRRLPLPRLPARRVGRAR